MFSLELEKPVWGPIMKSYFLKVMLFGLFSGKRVPCNEKAIKSAPPIVEVNLGKGIL